MHVVVMRHDVSWAKSAEILKYCMLCLILCSFQKSQKSALNWTVQHNTLLHYISAFWYLPYVYLWKGGLKPLFSEKLVGVADMSPPCCKHLLLPWIVRWWNINLYPVVPLHISFSTGFNLVPLLHHPGVCRAPSHPLFPQVPVWSEG